MNKRFQVRNAKVKNVVTSFDTSLEAKSYIKVANLKGGVMDETYELEVFDSVENIVIP
jgi:hypothetical protein